MARSRNQVGQGGAGLRWFMDGCVKKRLAQCGPLFCSGRWWSRQDLNLRPCACKAPALPLRQSTTLCWCHMFRMRRFVIVSY